MIAPFPKPRPLPSAKPQRLPQRKAVTIVAGFKSSASVVLAADTQEIIGEHLKMSVPKLKRYVDADPWRAVIGGAGGSDIIEHAFEQIESINAGVRSTKEFREALDDILSSIYDKYIYSRPDDVRSENEFRLLIGLWTEKDSLTLLQTSGPLSIPCPRGYGCVGWGESHARKMADQWYTGGLGEKETVLLANYILKHTKRYEPNCGGNTHILTLDECGVSGSYSPEECHDDEAFTDLFDLGIQFPFFYCANPVSLSPEQIVTMSNVLAQYLQLLMNARKEQLEKRQVEKETYALIREKLKELRQSSQTSKPGT
jgi:hypothetical protein